MRKESLVKSFIKKKIAASSFTVLVLGQNGALDQKYIRSIWRIVGDFTMSNILESLDFVNGRFFLSIFSIANVKINYFLFYTTPRALKPMHL